MFHVGGIGGMQVTWIQQMGCGDWCTGVGAVTLIGVFSAAVCIEESIVVVVEEVNEVLHVC